MSYRTHIVIKGTQDVQNSTHSFYLPQLWHQGNPHIIRYTFFTKMLSNEDKRLLMLPFTDISSYFFHHIEPWIYNLNRLLRRLQFPTVSLLKMNRPKKFVLGIVGWGGYGYRNQKRKQIENYLFKNWYSVTPIS